MVAGKQAIATGRVWQNRNRLVQTHKKAAIPKFHHPGMAAFMVQVLEFITDCRKKSSLW